MTRAQAETSLESLAREIGRTSSLVQECPRYTNPDEQLAMVRMLDGWEKRAFDIVRALQADPRAPDAEEHDPLCSEGVRAGDQTMPCDCNGPRPAEAPPSHRGVLAAGLRFKAEPPSDLVTLHAAWVMAKVKLRAVVNEMVAFDSEPYTVAREDYRIARDALLAYPIPAALLPVEMPAIESGDDVLFIDTGHVLEPRRVSVKLLDGHVVKHREIVELFRDGLSIWRRP